ncbi:MAG: BMP family ABC transporter substrate-binding protein [Oscillospiraceae bacterium]|nr:BMP family ABC transporter substrate-binding protein [Oscillospiraceae bacterium]
MKKIIIAAVIIVAAIVIGILAIQSYESDDESVVTVGLILNGSASDKSWSQSHYEAMAETAEELGINLVYRESVLESDLVKVVDELVEEGSNIIICNSFGYGEYLPEAAEKYPEVYFYHASGIEHSDNVTTFFGRMYQIRYLSGIVAGMQTETNEIGYVAAFPISEVNRGINAFTLGVRSVNPDAKVFVSWTNSWVDDTAAENASKQLIDNHNIDILTMHVDSVAPLKVADENGVMSIGYNIDNSAEYPDTYLTAAVWSWENFYISQINECIQNRFNGRNYWNGIDTGIVSLAPLGKNAKPEIQKKIDEETEALTSGRFDVFYGPVMDSNGSIRVSEGESMSDDVMLNSFDWYVEGVVIDEE